MIQRIIFFILFFSLSTRAAPQLNPIDLEAQFRDSRESIIQSEKRKRQILSKLFHLNRKIKKMAEEKGNLSDGLIVLNSQAKKVAKKINLLESSISRQKANLNSRLRALYKIRGQGYLRVLFSAATPQDLERNTRFLSIVAQKDFELIQSYRKTRSELVREKAKLKKKVRRLVSIKKRIQKNEAELAKEQKAKSNLARSIEKQKSWYLSRIKELRMKSKDFEMDGYSLLSSQLFFEQKGNLARPTQQRVVHRYGLRTLGHHGTQLNHKGLQFASGENRGVKSIYKGKVQFAGRVPGLGQVLIIDHSDHYYSVYANLKKITVVEAEEVESEQGIALVNDRGLYFEIRHYSQPENPERWLRSDELKLSANPRKKVEG